MYKHWNEIPARWGLFNQNGEARTPYYFYLMLADMGGSKLLSSSDDNGLKVYAAREDGKNTVLISNYSVVGSQDRNINVMFDNLPYGMKKLTVYRIDGNMAWDGYSFELKPVEFIRVNTLTPCVHQLYSPADSIIMINVEDKL